MNHNVYLSLFLSACLMIILGVLLFTSRYGNTTQLAKIESPESRRIHTEIQKIPTFNASLLIPKSAKGIVEHILDLDGDAINEHALQYTLDNVVRAKNDLRTISYISIYRFDGNKWQEIKKDEVTNDGGSVESRFCDFRIVNLGNNETEEVMVEKCGRHSSKGYYIYGQEQNGKLDDFPIPKGYLHEKDYLHKGEDFMQFLGVTIDKNDNIRETYGFACPARDWYAGRFGDQFGGWCREIELVIPYNNSTNSFGVPEQIIKCLYNNNKYQCRNF